MKIDPFFKFIVSKADINIRYISDLRDRLFHPDMTEEEFHKTGEQLIKISTSIMDIIMSQDDE